MTYANGEGRSLHALVVRSGCCWSTGSSSSCPATATGSSTGSSTGRSSSFKCNFLFNLNALDKGETCKKGLKSGERAAGAGEREVGGRAGGGRESGRWARWAGERESGEECSGTLVRIVQMQCRGSFQTRGMMVCRDTRSRARCCTSILATYLSDQCFKFRPFIFNRDNDLLLSSSHLCAVQLDVPRIKGTTVDVWVKNCGGLHDAVGGVYKNPCFREERC